MAKTTIEWTSSVNAKGEVVPGFSFNPWWGCVKVSPGCEHCYAETFAKRTGHSIWGPAATTQRRTFGDKHWQEPLKWNEDAVKAGERRRVFCASMADVFEDHPQLLTERVRLWKLIDQTPALDWLLLTKRPENITDMAPCSWVADGYPLNVWIGTSVENQAMADKRIPLLLQIPAAVRFLSCEPLLGPLDLSGRTCNTVWIDQEYADADPGFAEVVETDGWPIDWVIVGGESGPKARPMEADWVRSVRDQCTGAGVAFHFKQWGGVRKHETGRTLDGRTWDEYPQAVAK